VISSTPGQPHQSQGACTAIEDAAALGLIFSRQYPQFSNDVPAGLEFYQKIRKPRATRVQAASARATENLNERIGFSSLNAPEAKLAAQAGKLTVNEMNEYKVGKGSMFRDISGNSRSAMPMQCQHR
jgi:salicylate hydroxylase